MATNAENIVFTRLLAKLSDRLAEELRAKDYSEQAVGDGIAELEGRWRREFNRAGGRENQSDLDTRRDAQEIQQVHDMFVQIMLDEVELPIDVADMPYFSAITDVLCWVLSHSHNDSFDNLLLSLRRLIRDCNYQVFNKDTDEPLPEDDLEGVEPFGGMPQRKSFEEFSRRRKTGMADALEEFLREAVAGRGKVVRLVPENMHEMSLEDLHSAVRGVEASGENEPQLLAMLRAEIAMREKMH
jgi:hypothetical protein